MVESVSQGGHEARFDYTIDGAGNVRIASAKLSEPKTGNGPTYAVHYDYDNEGRLCRTSRSNPGFVRPFDKPQDNSRIVSR